MESFVQQQRREEEKRAKRCVNVYMCVYACIHMYVALWVCVLGGYMHMCACVL